MADENKPAFYPRVGNIKAKNFVSAQPVPFIEDPRAMDLPQFGEMDLSKPTKENLEMGKRIAQRDAELKRQSDADMSPLEKIAGGLQAGRFLGSAAFQGINSMPTRLAYGDEAAEKFIQDRIYKPTQPKAYEYAQDVGDFLESLETEYKLPAVATGEVLGFAPLIQAGTADAIRKGTGAAVRGGMALERGMEPVVRGALERGGLPREMVLAMGANTQSNVVKPYGGNWLGGADQLAIPENDLRRLKDSRGIQPDALKQLEADLAEISALPNAERKHDFVIRQMQDEIDRARIPNAINKWIDSNLKNYVKKEMGTRDDPVRKLAEEGIIHTPLREDLHRMEYLQDIRKAEGYPAEGMGKSELAKQWENLSDDAIRVSKAGNIQEQANTGAKLKKARAELGAHKKQIDDDFITFLQGKGGLEIKDREVFDKMPQFQKAEILGDTKYKELQGIINDLLGQEHGFEKRAGELNPFVAKLDPETRLYSGSTYDLGFDHIVDVLKEDLGTGRIRPEQLNKVSMEQAVRRTYEYDQELAKKMNEARLTARAELPVYKEYPEGLKWVELNRPGDFAAESDAMGHSVRGYEPPEGHPDWTKGSGDSGYSGYGLGGWDAIKRGKAKVYSLIDAKGEPHVTIEVGAYPDQLRAGNLKPYTQAAIEEAKLLPNGYTDADVRDIEIRMAKENMPKYINQIKGKQNAKPKDEYLPFVQDFVRGGNWSDVRDFQNTDLISADKIRQAGWDMTGVDKKYLTKQEYDDLLLNELNKPKGMKRGGKVSISSNPDAMMMELNNQKMKNGVPAYGAGSAVTKMGLKAAKMEAPRIAMQFGNDLPLNMADDLIKRSPSVDRINMNYKDVTKRVPELTEAAQKLQAGELDRETYAKLVQALKPVKPYDFVPKPATADEARGALKEDARDTYGIPSKTLEAGHPVGLRLDIPAYTNKGVWVPTVHEQDAGFGAGKKIGHESVASVLNPEFGMSEKAALSIASGKPKGTIATIKGDWNPTSEADIIAKAKEYLKHPEWRQVGMDPERHSYFYDRETMAPVVNAEEVIQIGPLVLAKNPKFGKVEDFKYSGGGLTGAINLGLKAAKPAKIDVPIRFPVSRGPSVPEIRAMAERMAPQVMGEFVRAAPTPSNPKPSTSVTGKTQKQFEREKTLPIEYQNIKEPVTPEEFDYAQKKGALLIGAQGDVTPGNRMLMSIDEQPLSVPVHLQAGPEWELYNPSAWAASDQMAKTYMNRADKAAEAYNADPYLHYHKMTPDANFYAMHHLNSVLGHLRPEELMLRNPKLYQQMVEEIRTRDVGFGKHPEFEGFEDPLNLQIHAQMDPNFRRHLSAIFNGPKFTERYGLNSGQDVMAATSLPELRDLEAGASGYAIVPLDVKAPLKHFEAESQTYDTGFPKAGASGRSKYPSPYELIYRDTLNWMKDNPSEKKSSEFGRMNMIVPKQQIDNELIEAIGEYQRRMKELTGKKKGGAVKKAAGGAISGDDLILEERPL